ncbi:hypothetical protein BKA65DRAFT_130158 [Rhexocercosporidium sp. MPI-PUGE-AT-0058]|nr:hypothetical protein BKA65DRAFT_130158 [Rhexocercosporidium sp. MPI-PUGE-AT-0058]
MYSSILIVGAGVALVLYVLGRLYPCFAGDKKNPYLQYRKVPMSDVDGVRTDLFKIDPLPDFDWRTTPPLKVRPFKPKYHLTMAVNTSNFSELIEMDRNYLDRVTLRKQIMQEHHDIAIQAKPEVKPAIDELYRWLVNAYLPIRYPTMFSITPLGLLNHVTSKPVPLEPSSDPAKTFEILGENLDEDILILLPSADGDGYTLKGYVTCFPAGFNTKEKLGMKLRDIHTPVPGYKQKLELSMDRFFDRLEVGKVVKRANWSINTEEKLFAASGLHFYEGHEVVDEEVDINTTFLRCERQLLHRLPNTKALVFNFKTYLYPLREIKEEGLGEELARAIDGLKEGNTPAMHFYKRGVVWGEAVKAYLRS